MEIKRKLYKSILHSLTGRLSVFLFQMLSLAIFSRIFEPQDFGVIAAIQVFVVFFQLLSDIGIGPAIINESKITGKSRDGIFTFTLMFGLLIFSAFLLLIPSISELYSYDYSDIGAVIGISIVFNSLSIIPVASINKDSKFILLAKIDVFIEIFCIIIMIIIYKLNQGVLTLAYKFLIQAILRLCLTWYMSKFTEIGRSKFGCDIFAIKLILSFSVYQFAFNFVNYFSRNLDNLLISKFFGMTAVGVYNRGYQLMRYPLLITTFAMTPAIQPVITKVRDHLELVIVEHNILSRKLFVLSLVISIFTFFNAKSIVEVLLGDKWHSVIPIIEIFAFMIPVQGVICTSGSFFQAMNKPKLLFYAGVIASVFMVSGILIGIYFGTIESVSISIVTVYYLNFFFTYYILFKYAFSSTIKDCVLFVFALIKSSLSLFLPAVVYLLLRSELTLTMSPIIDLIVNMSIYAFSLSFFYYEIKRSIV